MYDTSTERSSNQAPFDKIGKSGDGGSSGGCLGTKGGSLNLTFIFLLDSNFSPWIFVSNISTST